VVASQAVTYVSGGNESAAFEWNETQIANAKVYYKKSGASSYTQIDDSLIRMKDSKTARADVLGLAAGTYDFKIEGAATLTISSVTVKAYDRSGYAHYGAGSSNGGIGAYKDDGTLKSNAQVIYVSEATKNTVTATFDKKNYTGIVDILKNLSESKVPVAIRIIGQISAATWKQIVYAGNTFDKSVKTAITPEDVTSADGTKKLIDYVDENSDGSKKATNFTQSWLIENGFNELDTSTYSALNGISSTSKIKYDEKKNEFDSCWNDCPISGASNVTFEGVGEDAEIFQWGLTWKNCNYIEVRNLTFDDYTEDACSFEGNSDATDANSFASKYLWIHHNTFNEGINYWDVCKEQDKHEGDGATDFKKLSYVTISYNKYYKNHKTGLIGGGDTQTTASVTFHHNYYLNCVSRLPLARQANMHMYNNYYCGSTGTNMSIRAGGYAFIENCYFENANNPIQTQDGSNLRGVAKVYGCVFNNSNYSSGYTMSNYNVTVVTDRTAKVDNDNIYNKNFDTDDTAFYYDSINKKSDVTVMHTAEQTKELVPMLAGTLKHNNQLN
jgi:pectate lyase